MSRPQAQACDPLGNTTCGYREMGGDSDNILDLPIVVLTSQGSQEALETTLRIATRIQNTRVRPWCVAAISSANPDLGRVCGGRV